MASILIVEDDVSVAEGISDRLSAEGHLVTVVHDGKAGLQQAWRGEFDIIILDIMLPGKVSGFDVCRQLRKDGNPVLILMLTAKREELDRVKGLDLGADDYMLKPFSVTELQARIRALMRRTRDKGRVVPFVHFGNVEVDFVSKTARVNGEVVHLSPKAFGVLRVLAGKETHAMGREELLHAVWGYDKTPTTRVVDVVINEIRDRLGEDSKNPVHILTVHGIGYRFVSGGEKNAIPNNNLTIS